MKLVWITSSWEGILTWISLWLDKNCRFFTCAMVKSWVSPFFFASVCILSFSVYKGVLKIGFILQATALWLKSQIKCIDVSINLWFWVMALSRGFKMCKNWDKIIFFGSFVVKKKILKGFRSYEMSKLASPMMGIVSTVAFPCIPPLGVYAQIAQNMKH